MVEAAIVSLLGLIALGSAAALFEERGETILAALFAALIIALFWRAL